MGLSEHEKRVLDELERSLYADDEPLARRFKEAAGQTPDIRRQRNASRRVAGVFVAVAGLGVILLAVIIHYVLIGLAGFVLTLLGLLLATSSSASLDRPKGSPSAAAVATEAAAAKAVKRATGTARTIRQYFEDKWDNRGGNF